VLLVELFPCSGVWQLRYFRLLELEAPCLVIFIKILDQISNYYVGRDVTQAISCRSQPRRLGLEPWSGHVEFMVDKGALRQVFSEYLGFPCQAFHRLLQTHHHPTSSGAGTMDQ
jgi:hypothetical protein